MDEKTKDKLALLFPKERPRIRSGDLTEMRFEVLDLSQLDFSDADFGGAVFLRCVLSQSIFSRCSFDTAIIENSIGEAAMFTDCFFRQAEIKDTKFDDSFFIRCGFPSYFSGTKVSFIRVNFTGSNFTGASRMEGSHFDDCCLDSVVGLDQDYLKKRFWETIHKEGNDLGWRAIDAVTNKSLLGKSPEKPGDVIEIPKHEVDLDSRAGCKSGLHICRTKSLADEFGKAHYFKYKLVPIDFSFENILVVHLSGDFCRVNEYKVMEE